MRTDLQEIKKALTPIGDNPDPERKEKPDIECPVEERPRTRRFKAFSWQGCINVPEKPQKATQRTAGGKLGHKNMIYVSASFSRRSFIASTMY